MLSQIKHAKGRILGKNSHNHYGTSLLYSFHKAPYTAFHTGHLKSHLIPFIAEDFPNSILKGCFGNIERILNSALAGYIQTMVTHVCNQNLFRASRYYRLSDQIADGTSPGHYYILSLKVSGP